MLKRTLSCLILTFIFIPIVSQQLFAEDALLELLEDELKREMSALKNEENPPYFMSFRVEEKHSARVTATFGNVVDSDKSTKRYFTPMVRIGDYNMDNTRELRGGSGFENYFGNLPSFNLLPLENDEKAIRQLIWKVVDDQYRQAVDKYAKVKANTAVKVAAEDTSADFSRVKSGVKYVEPPLKKSDYDYDLAKWEEKVKKYSEPFLDDNRIFSGSASVRLGAERKYYVSSEDTKLAQNTIRARIMINAIIKSDDGMELPLYKSYFAYKPEDLPSDEEILKDVDEMVEKLKKLVEAPVVAPYEGPAILSGRASGVFFHEIFGHRIEGHRQKSEDEGQTFKKKVGGQILPEHMSVIFDPDMKEYGGHDLNGYYLYDDQGVKGQKVPVIDHGVLKEFLMSRSPIENFKHSNGHGRAQYGYKPVSRQSNLIVKTDDPKSKEDLRKILIEECKKQGKEYGYLFEDITGGFTLTGRTIPNSFNVMPTEVYRVYVDGRPDELVRGVDLVGTPLAMFSQIAEAGNDIGIFNGTCGAESGGVPVSACSPSIFVKKIEMQKKSKAQDKPPLLPRPGSKPGSN